MKKISLSVALIMIFGMLAITTTSAEDASFPDLESDDPSITAISYLKDEGIVEGYPDGTFQSLSKINRAEFMKIVVESITDNAEGSECFSDVHAEWFAKYICYGKTQGIVSGYADGTFHPEQDINFAEASKIIVNALDLTKASETDSAAITALEEQWYTDFAQTLSAQNAIPTSISDFDKSIARGEMAEMIWRLKENQTDLEAITYEELEGVPLKIQSCDELEERFMAYVDSHPYYDDDVSEDSSADTNSSTTSAESYSTTNLQVEGVDEADLVKNDGTYIYMVKDSDDSVRIIQAYPVDTLAEVAKITFDDAQFSPGVLYITDDTLVVIGRTYASYTYTQTSVYIYDVSDRAAPVLERSLTLDGSFSGSRRIGATLYLLASYSPYMYGEYDLNAILPSYTDSIEDDGASQNLVDCTDVQYFPREENFAYLITAAIPLDAETSITSDVFLGDGYAENVYVSSTHLYTTMTNYDYNDYYYDWTNARTIVYRYDLGDGTIAYADRGKIPGTVLNQFSLDEHNGYLRVATTQGNVFDTENPATNNVYILDDAMDIVGSLEGIAPGERIYSVRFLGDAGYMVTFKKIDPLFAMDLSDPYNPVVLGELEIPGYSDYLQPYDETHLIGFGKDAEDASEEETAARNLDFAWYQGMKIALFDVSDMSNPQQLFSEGIGDRGTESDILYNHKALLFDASQNLLAFPITVAEVSSPSADANTYGDDVFQGAYVYTVNLTNGFSLRGTMTNFPEGQSYFSSWDEEYIDRIIYIGDNLYTIAQGMITANDIETTEERNTLVLAE